MSAPAMLFFFGDSLTQGIGDPAMSGWPGRIMDMAAQKGSVPFAAYNLGARGHTSLAVKERWVDETSSRLVPDVRASFVFCFGAADVTREVDPDQTLEAAAKMLSTAKGMGPTLFVTPPPLLDADLREKQNGLFSALKGVCTDLDVPCVDLFSELADDKGYLKGLENTDKIHPDPKGYDLMAEKLWHFPAFKSHILKAC